MPNRQQHGPQNGRHISREMHPDEMRDARNRRSAGGRSESYARQRDQEQLRAGYDRDEWNRAGETYRTVQSEPQWDPNRYSYNAHNDWVEQQNYGRPRGPREEDERFYGSAPYDRYRGGEERYRGAGASGGGSYDRYGAGASYGAGSYDRYGSGYGSRDDERRARYGYDDGLEVEHRRIRGAEYRASEIQANPYGGMRGERGIRAQDWGRSDQERGRGEWGGEGEHHEESFGHQLQDAGRRLLGRVKRLVRNPKNYKRSDERIREDICDRLSVSSEVDPTEVEVMVEGGEVTLTGSVANRQMKFAVEEIADDVAGVHEVHNQLRIMRPTQSASAPTNVAINSPEAGSRGKNIGRS